jgi:hypothetical protein
MLNASSINDKSLDEILGLKPTTLMVVGAYGRDVRLADWIAGKDFKIHEGPYCSVRDVTLLKDQGYSRIHFVSPIRGQSFTLDL